MSERSAFLHAIRANPDDDTARLVFADWLDEHDEPERAEFIRVQIELEPIRFRIDNPRAVELHAREDALLRQHGDEWIGTNHLLTNPADFGPVFRRGFAERACLSLDTFLTNGEVLFAAHPTLREVALYGLANRCDELTMSPLLTNLNTLEIADWPTDDDVSALSASPHLPKIAHFKLWIGGNTELLLQELVEQSDVFWPASVELIQVCGGAMCHDPDTAIDLNNATGDLAAIANDRLGRDAVRVTRPFDQLFPLNGDLGYNLCAGHLPDGTPALAAGSFGQWLLITFTDDGHIGDVEVRESSVRVKDGPGGADSFALGTAFREWVDEKARLESGLIWVREFAVENLSIELWDSMHAERVSSPFVIPLGAWNAQDWRDQCAKARSWLERRNFVINWFNDYWADWRGKIHSS